MATEDRKDNNDGSSANLNGMGVGFWIQTRLLIEKNWKCKLRTSKIKLAGEIFVPVLYLLLLSFLVMTQPNTQYPKQSEPNSPPQNILQGLWESNGINPQRIISIVPRGRETEKICQIMKDILERKGMPSTLECKYFSTVEDLERAFSKSENGTDLAVIVSNTNPNSFNYTIMTDPLQVPLPSQKTVGLDTCRMKPEYNDKLEVFATCPVNGYFYSGFLGMQYLVDQAFLNLSSGSSQNGETPNIEIQNYPKAKYNGGMSAYVRVIIPIYCVIPLAQLINSLLVLIVTEKEERIKDGFRMIGVSDGAYWLSWFSVYSIIIGILSVLFTLVMHLANILPNINVVLLFMIFFLFGLSVITFAFALTPFFHKPKTAGVVGTLILQFCGMLFLIQTFVKPSTDSFLVPLRLISSLAFTTALDEACAYEFHGGISFNDLVPGGRGELILYSLIFLFFDTVFYAIIAIYLDNVIPNEYGAKKHPLFCFTYPFWKSSVGCGKGSLNNTRTNQDINDNPNVEGVPPSMIKNQAITIRNIFKTYTSLFGTTKVEAIKGISLDIYEGQITAILGKNGAGKSTLFNMISGLVPPSKGKCNVFGMDTSNPHEMDHLRKITGVCLQTNLLFPSLTAEEHLQLYGKLRGLHGAALDNEVGIILEELKLTEKTKAAADKLSGGQQRKLSVGIALIGDPKIILLDEPSAGVDPVSRRHLWSLLKRKKEGRVILLATHFLDEADFLADKKAIIHNGVLKCHGSSLFLKNRFGIGYHLTVETEVNAGSEHCDSVIQRWIPDALESKKVIGKEIKYCLPNSEIHIFADLFEDLEQLIVSENSTCKSYGVSMTTLEEVFLKISDDAWGEDKSSLGSSSLVCGLGGENAECNLIPDSTEIKINIRESLWALSLLRIRRLSRSPQSLFFLVIMPLAFVAGGLALMKVQNTNTTYLLPLGDPKGMYSSKDQLRLAFSKHNNLPNLQNFMEKKGFQVHEYSGEYSDLLNSDLSDPGTMVALASNTSLTTLRINGTFLHSPPLLLNMISQYYLKNTGLNASLYTYTKSFSSKKIAFDPTTLVAAFLIGPSFCIPAVAMVMELVQDRKINARNHLRVNGVSFGLYFSSIFIVFGLLSTIVTLSQIALIYIFGLAAFMNPHAITVTITLLLLFIVPCLLFSALFSYLFERLEAAQSIFFSVSYLMGYLGGIVIIVMDNVAGLTGSNNVLIVHGFFSAIDVFYIPLGVFYWINKQFIICSLTDKCDELTFSDYLGPEILIMAICLIVQIPIFLVLIVIADVAKHGGNPWSAIISIFKKGDMNSCRIHILNDDNHGDGVVLDAVDEDVLDEKAHVANILSGRDQSNDSVVLVHNLRKTYRAKTSIKEQCRKTPREGHKALKGINFTVEKGEVFGLLGHNGAGKTTAMRIITAEESPDAGIVRVCGQDIDSNYSDAFLKLGYCAQHDPLWENISLREHLELYAVIRGIPSDKRNRIINQFLIGLQIEEHASKKVAQLSGGTKRKLSYGISMLGAPQAVLLDEPSTGMDPQSKRFLWNTILGSFKESRGAILTTHSMEEAEILCTRIGILAKCSLICIGSPQHLKSKYGSGYTLEIKLKSTNDVVNTDQDRYKFVKAHFPDCKVNELFDDKAVFALSTASVPSISKVFSLLEQLKQQYNIEEYSFSQTTLEQIFLNLAKDEETDEYENECGIARDVQLVVRL